MFIFDVEFWAYMFGFMFAWAIMIAFSLGLIWVAITLCEAVFG